MQQCLCQLLQNSPPICLGCPLLSENISAYILTEVTLFSDCWKIFVRRFGSNRGHTFLLDHWLSLSGGCFPVSLSPCLLQCRPGETCFFAERWCGLRSVVRSISAGKHQIYANPASAWKWAFCRFLTFFTARANVKAFQMGGAVLYHMGVSKVHI